MDTKNIGDSVIWDSNIGTHNGVIKNFVYYGDKEFIQLQCDALIQEIENTKEMLDKVNFQLNVKNDKNINEENKIKIGQFYIIKGVGVTNEKFFLCQVEASMVCLISIQTGNRWNDPVKVKDVFNITEEEFYRIKMILSY